MIPLGLPSSLIGRLFSLLLLVALLLAELPTQAQGRIQAHGASKSIDPVIVDMGKPETFSNKAVVFDFDGTITCFSFNGGIRAGAAEAMALWMDMGYQVVLVTARPQIVEWWTCMQLSFGCFPVDRMTAMIYAPCFVSGGQESLDYKREAINTISNEMGLEILYAYGDSTHDFDAYGEAGINSTNVFAFRSCFASDCNAGSYAGCLNDYVAHIDDFIKGQPLAL